MADFVADSDFVADANFVADAVQEDLAGLESIARQDPAVYQWIVKERQRQEDHLELIASENYTSVAVREACGSILTNKYAEGYPGRRYYGGCEFVDEIEQLAIDRAMALFGAEHANVQPYSGSNPNAAVYLAMLEPGDTVMGMSLAQGGHLTHGHPKNFSGLVYNFVPYGVNLDTELIDYAEVERIAHECQPRLIVGGATAYSRIIDFARLREIADSVGALFMVDMAHIAGIVAADLHPSPVPHAHFVTSSTHKTLRGPRGGIILCQEEFAKKVDSAIFPGLQGGPFMHIMAGKAVALAEAMTPEFRAYSKSVLENADALATTLMEHGLRVVSGGTDNHLMVVDFGKEGPSGKVVEAALAKANITVNKNTVPRETRSAFVTSGIRIGSPAVTSRGMGVPEMQRIGTGMAEVVHNRKDAATLQRVQRDVLDLCDAFPAPA